MVQNQEVKISFFASGFCTAHARVVNPKHGRGLTKFYAVWALMEHPSFGILLFDAGYNNSFKTITQKWPEWLYGKATPVTLQPNETAVEILKSRGIKPEDVNYFVVSHFHGDHMCAMQDFPNAKFICSEDALSQVFALNGFAAVRVGILKKLLPDHFENRVVTLESMSEVTTDQSGLEFYNPFGLTDLSFMKLPGHAKGMIGFYAKAISKDLLYATDASWERRAFFESIQPLQIVRLFFDSWNDFIETNKKLHRFLNEHPHTEILFTHCPETLRYISNVV